ncbi:MAG TPA: DUF4440 domain-containing protein [Candidatus Acidoferrales bacterium]|nr:DUF4440 domain-containing protein [Candidatus Acidoferrales bacterium]
MLSFAQHPATLDPAQSLTEIIESLSFGLSSALNDRDIEAALYFFTPDAVMIAPDNPGVSGKPAIHTLFENMLANSSLALNLSQSSIGKFGDLAVEIGSYSMQLARPYFGKWEDTGKYITAWRRQPTGQFLITVTVWTHNT